MKHSTSRRRRTGAMAFAGAAALCAAAAVMVPVAHVTQAVSPGDSGMVCTDGTPTSTPTGTTRVFSLTATEGWTSEPDGNAIYDWSYTASGAFQLPGPVLCAYTGETVVVNLQNHLPVPTSIQFPGQTGVTYSYANPSSSGPVGPVADVQGNLLSLVQEAQPTIGSVSYTFKVDHEGTYVYESGTDPELQVQMGLFGALVVYPSGITFQASDLQDIPVDGGSFTNGSPPPGFAPLTDTQAKTFIDAKEVGCAYASVDTPGTCDSSSIFEKDRENILILSEVDPGLHSFMEQQVQNGSGKYHWGDYPNGYAPHYFMINGRSMPDTIAPNFASWLPAQPYTALATVEPWDPKINPLDAFIRYVGIGIAPYDFHPHSNHERVIAQDARLMKGAGNDNTEEKFNILVGPGATLDATFRWTNEEGYKNATGDRVPVQWPQGADMLEGDFWSGSPYLGTSGLLNPGILTKTQCGEYYHVAHNHDLTQVTNYGITFGGMLTLIKVEPLGTSVDTTSKCSG
jgi:hypothetical protein